MKFSVAPKGHMYRHFFFDMDNTVTRAKSLVTPEMRSALVALMEFGRDVIIVSGQTESYIKKQTEDLPCVYLGQSGNHALDAKTGRELWRRELGAVEKREIFNHIKSLPRDWKVTDEADLIEDRGSQISYSLLGHHEQIEKKEAFDPDFSKRKKLLHEYPLNSDTIEVKIGGTTTLDYVRKGHHKGFNVAALIAQMKWNKNECLYVGDRLFPGGNDETVMGVIDTKSVSNPEETFAFLQEILTSTP